MASVQRKWVDKKFADICQTESSRQLYERALVDRTHLSLLQITIESAERRAAASCNYFYFLCIDLIFMSTQHH